MEAARALPRAKRRSYPCPFPICHHKQHSRLADHLATFHQMKGSGWKKLRSLLLDIAHRLQDDDLSDAERNLVSRLPRKVEDYMQPTASSKVVTYCTYRVNYSSQHLHNSYSIFLPEEAEDTPLRLVLLFLEIVAVAVFSIRMTHPVKKTSR